jgi:hypothetical protein
VLGTKYALGCDIYFVEQKWSSMERHLILGIFFWRGERVRAPAMQDITSRFWRSGVEVCVRRREVVIKEDLIYTSVNRANIRWSLDISDFWPIPIVVD